MTEVTRILNAIEQGDAKAADELLPLVYEELRRLAGLKMSQEPPGQENRRMENLELGIYILRPFGSVSRTKLRQERSDWRFSICD